MGRPVLWQRHHGKRPNVGGNFTGIKPTPTVTNDVNLINVDDDMWQVMVLTHVFVNGREVGQSVWMNIVSIHVPS